MNAIKTSHLFMITLRRFGRRRCTQLASVLVVPHRTNAPESGSSRPCSRIPLRPVAADLAAAPGVSSCVGLSSFARSLCPMATQHVSCLSGSCIGAGSEVLRRKFRASNVHDAVSHSQPPRHPERSRGISPVRHVSLESPPLREDRIADPTGKFLHKLECQKTPLMPEYMFSPWSQYGVHREKHGLETPDRVGGSRDGPIQLLIQERPPGNYASS